MRSAVDEYKTTCECASLSARHVCFDVMQVHQFFKRLRRCRFRLCPSSANNKQLVSQTHEHALHMNMPFARGAGRSNIPECVSMHKNGRRTHHGTDFVVPIRISNSAAKSSASMCSQPFGSLAIPGILKGTALTGTCSLWPLFRRVGGGLLARIAPSWL